MLAFIKANYQVGDSMEVNCSEGVILGQIEYVDNQFIVLRQPNGQICGIAASDVKSFTAKSPVRLVPAQGTTATIAPTVAEDAVEEEKGKKLLTEQSSAEEEASETITLGQVLDEKEIPSADELTGVASIVQPKVIGHIDLDSLQRIDPKYQRRNYFKSENTAASASTEATSNYSAALRPAFLRAKGRISFYNPTKRFGFIHDFKSDADLYFYVQQVADNSLFDQLHRGTKVCYSIGQNNQGPMAMAVHLPHLVSEIIDMAEEHLGERRYAFAKHLLEQVLEAAPDNQKALNLLEEVNSEMPEEQPLEESRTFVPCTTYAEAKKAYLEKDYAKAEELYLRAIEAGEKAESSVKDMLTLYVSCFKQADEAGREDVLQKANQFLQSNRHLLSDTLTTKQFLALNYFLPTQNYDAFISMVDDILADSQVSHILSRKLFYLWQKGIALHKQSRTDEALALIEDGLKLAPHNRQLNNLRESILHPGQGAEGLTMKQSPEEETEEAKEE